MLWALESDLPWSAALSDHLTALCDVAEERRTALEQLASEGFRLDLFCFVEVEHGQGGVHLEQGLLRRLALLPVALDLDIYGSEGG